MQSPTPTSVTQTLPLGATESTCFQVDFPANHFPKPASGKVLPTTATYGRKCYEQFVKSDRAGSWEKTFLGLLIGMEGWFSTRCALTWKVKVTPFNRSYCQLVGSMRRTKGTEPGLLPTVTTTNSSQGFHSRNRYGLPLLPMAALLQTPTVTAIECRSAEGLVKRKEMRNRSGRITVPPGNLAEQIHSVMNGGTLTDMSAIIPEDTPKSDTTVKLLPTPSTWDSSGGPQKVPGRAITRPSGVTFSTGLRDLAHSGLLPTPNTALYKTTGLSEEAWEKRIADKRQEDLNMAIYRKTGSTSQLSPQFVEEMMGFPRFYTVLPFLAGEKNPSKPTETP